jgi:3-oxoadipate enol-lactonase
MSELTTKHGVIEYSEHGEGQPLIMLRGLGRTVRHWAGFERQMARHFRVITFDLRGIGTNKVPISPRHSLFDVAEDIVEILDHLKIEKASLLGVSLGGMVALACGLRFPERVHSLIIVNSSIAGQKIMRLTPIALATISRAAWDPKNLESKLVDVLTGPDLPTPKKKKIADLYNQIRTENGMPLKAVASQLAGAARFFVADRLKGMKPPTLVIYGSNDRFVPVENSKRIASLIPDAKLFELKNAGHEAHLDKPEEFISAVKAWHDELSNR